MNILIIGLPLATFVIVANLVDKADNNLYRQRFDWLLLALGLPLIIMGITYVALPDAQLAEWQAAGIIPTPNIRGAGIGLIVMGAWTTLASIRPLRQQLAHLLPFNPNSTVHTLALALMGMLVGNTITTLGEGGLQDLADAATAASTFDLIAQQLLFTIIAFLGVGLFIRRDDAAIRQRLGLKRPTAAQLWLGIRWIGALIILQWIGGALWFALNPDQFELLEGITGSLFAEVNTSWEWFIIALAVGIGEELLFRGALQPAFGLWFTAVIFAIAHIQYGITPITLIIFLIALALGYIRQTTSTTVAIFVHFGYDFVLGLLTLLATYASQFAP